MSKNLLIDYVPFNVARFLPITEGKSTEGRMRIRGKLQEAEQKNGNNRVYPRDVLRREVEKYINESVKNNTSMGELDHPESSIINLNNVSHIIKKIWWEANDLMGELELLHTPSGRIAQELILAGIPLGISSRGMGSVKQIGETVEVQDDFELLCWDLVSVPSTPNAYMRIAEGRMYKQLNQNKYEKVNSLITEIICNQTGVCPLCP